jgi:hypothetical protein
MSDDAWEQRHQTPKVRSTVTESRTVRVGVNGYGVIGKRVADALTSQPDMSLEGVSDVVTDWRAHIVAQKGFRLFGAPKNRTSPSRKRRSSKRFQGMAFAPSLRGKSSTWAVPPCCVD